jgi:hypothetical protein
MTNAKSITTDPELAARPKYYVPYGAEIASGNRAWVLAALMSMVALASLVMLFFVRMQPPTVIRIGPTGEAVVLGKSGSGSQSNSTASGTDAFLDQAFVKRFLSNYLNYSPANVDERWAASLNMMTRNLRSYTIKAMADGNIRGKIEDEQTQSVFHLREIDPDPGDPLAFLIYGVKDVHHLTNGTEVTDHFVNEYRVRLIADRRSDVNPDGLWIAEYSERPIDGERRDHILAASDREITNE